MEETIILYSKPNCAQCRQTKRLFEREGIPYKEINVMENEDVAEKLKAQGYRTMPVIQSGKTVILGFQPDDLRALV